MDEIDRTEPETQSKKGVQMHELSDLSSARFIQLVATEAKNHVTDPQITNWLRSEPMVEQWRDALSELLILSQEQFAGKRAEYELAKSEKEMSPREIAKLTYDYENWKRAQIRYKRLLETRLHEAKRLIAKRNAASYAGKVVEERNNAERRIEMLLDAIREHRDSIDFDDATEKDKELWGLLDEFENRERPRASA